MGAFWSPSTKGRQLYLLTWFQVTILIDNHLFLYLYDFSVFLLKTDYFQNFIKLIDKFG